jgi:hypothetical protein
MRGMAEIVQRERRPIWQHVTLPGSVGALAPSPTYHADRTVLAATSAGVSVSRDGGATFEGWSTGLGETPVVAIALSPTYTADRLVYAVELGGRIWRRRAH